MDTKTKLMGILGLAASDAYSLDTRIETERLADYLIANGVTIIPEGAVIMTKDELKALVEYTEKNKTGW
jgi:hypothetical protein